MKNNPIVVLCAVRENGIALYDASVNITNDQDIVFCGGSMKLWNY